MPGHCEACRGNINVTQKRIKCNSCMHLYHSECISFNNDTVSARSQWKCPNCIAAQRTGGDNSNTPVRGNKSQSQTSNKNYTISNCPPGGEASQTLEKIMDPISDNLSGNSPMHDEFLFKIENMLDNKLKALKLEIIEELKNSFFKEFNTKIEEILLNVKQVEESQNILLKDCEGMKRDITIMDKKLLEAECKLADITAQINKQQQWARMSNIEIIGIPQTTNESARDLVLKIAKHAGVDITYNHVESAQLVNPMQSLAGRPKPIVVKLKDRDVKDRILSGLRRTRGITTSDIGITGNSNKVFVNEHLTPENKRLLKRAKLCAKEKSYKFTWVRNCVIFLRKNEETAAITINTEKDLAKIV